MKHICTKFVAMLLVIAMIAGVLPFAFAANVGPFTDVKDTDWFASNVQYVYDNGLMNGTTTTTFEPESNLTRAQTAMVLWRIAGQPAPTAKAPFTDLVDAWYRDAIAWAAEQKVVNGRGDGTFDPAGFITREELVTMIWRYAGEAASEQDLSNWPDADKIYDYAAGAMKWAVETGVINGKDGKLAPKDNATRAQFAAIIERYMKLNDTKADDIVILYTNDVHANITGGSSKAPTLTYEQVAWYRNNLQTPYSLLVDAGDAIQGEAISTLTHGEAIVEVMNAAGYDYATFGNHEFDYGMDQLLDTIVPAAKYQYLTCNFARLDGTAIAGVKPYAIETFGSKKVAVIGISTPESFVKSTPTYFQDKDGNYIYTFAEGNNGQDLYDSVQKTIDAAKKDGADYVVAVAHLGIDESSEPWRSTDVIANTTGLDAVLDGHSHSTIPQEIVKSKDGKDVILSSTGTKLNNLGKLTISADGKLHSELISDREIEKDAKTKEVVDKIVAEFQALLNKVVAHTDVDLTTQNPEGTARAIRNRETNLGDLCADAYRVTLGADIAIVNGGGIRADIPAGDITYNQIIKVHPYGNMACVVEATGQEILDALEMASRNTMAEYVSESVDENGNKVYNAVGEMGGFLQVSGMKYTINTAVESTVKTDDKDFFVSVEGARRVQDVQVLNQTTNTYEPIDPAKTYTLASHNYMLKSGGDGINMFQDNKLLQDEVKIDNQVLIDYIVDSLGGNVGEQYKNLAGEGRITVVNETKPALKDNEYALSTELPDGAKVVFVNRSVSKAMSAANSEGSAYNRAGVDVTPVDGILTTDNDEIVWTVEKTEGGFFLKRTDGKKLSIGNKPDGGTYNSMGFDQEDNPVWKIAPAATDGCIYLQSATATGSSGDPKSVEWYAQYSNFSMYYVSSSNEALFAMDMYVNTGAGEPAPVATVTAKVPSTLREGAEIPAYITTPKGYKADGSFPFVVMIHGHGGNHNESDGFDKISNGLAEQGFVVATLDLPGCGKSKESFQLNTMTNMKADVLDVIDYVCKNYAVDKTRIGAFGYSMGGRITLELLAEGKYSFSTIELVAPAEDLTDLKNLFGGAEKWDTMKTEANEKGYAEFTTKYGQHQQLSKEWFADLEKYSDGLVEKAAENYTGDSLVIWATNDEAVSPSVSSAVATTLGSATLNTYADGHSYSFYGTTEYTISTVNNGSVNYFVNELKTNETRIHGYVQSIAKYGNLELTIPGSELDKAGFEYGDLLKITVDGKEFTVPYGTNYSDVDQGSTILRNSDGHLTLAINMGDFAGKNGIATKKTNEDKTYEWYYAAETNVPAVVTIEMGEKGGYYDEWLIHQLKRTNNREDYKHLSDAEFANFRNVATTGMGENALYRSSSPINDEIGRNTYADKAAEAAGVRTFMNLANDEATAKGYEGFDSTYYSKQNVVYLNLGVDFTAADFKTGLATGLRYFTTHEGPYLVHCTEGKDRAGFVSALLECYMGATYDEVVADYMVTYYNYYGVTKEAEPAKYDAILRSNIVKTLQTAFGVEDLKTADLKQEATDFFKELGLTESELTTLTANLSKKYTGGSTEPEIKLVKTELADIKATDRVIITMTTSADATFALLNNGGKSTYGPAAAFDGTTYNDTMLWNIKAVDGGYTIYVAGSTTDYLYGLADNNGLRVGTNDSGSVFSLKTPLDGQGQYLSFTDSSDTARYVGVYNNGQNFRCYAVKNGRLANITGQTLAFYVVTEG